MELPWLKNKPFISCVPQGDYFIRPTISPSKGEAYYLESVQDGIVGLNAGERTHILIHVANRPSELKGCIALGTGTGVFKGEVAVFNSRAPFKELLNFLDGYDYRLRIERF